MARKAVTIRSWAELEIGQPYVFRSPTTTVVWPFLLLGKDWKTKTLEVVGIEAKHRYQPPGWTFIFNAHRWIKEGAICPRSSTRS